MADRWSRHSTGIDGPANNAAAVTPNDSTDLAEASRGILVGGAGNVAVDMVGIGTNVTLQGLTAGQIYPLRVTRIYSTGTTATDIVALW